MAIGTNTKAGFDISIVLLEDLLKRKPELKNAPKQVWIGQGYSELYDVYQQNPSLIPDVVTEQSREPDDQSRHTDHAETRQAHRERGHVADHRHPIHADHQQSSLEYHPLY